MRLRKFPCVPAQPAWCSVSSVRPSSSADTIEGGRGARGFAGPFDAAPQHFSGSVRFHYLPDELGPPGEGEHPFSPETPVLWCGMGTLASIPIAGPVRCRSRLIRRASDPMGRREGRRRRSPVLGRTLEPMAVGIALRSMVGNVIRWSDTSPVPPARRLRYCLGQVLSESAVGLSEERQGTAVDHLEPVVP